MSPLKALASGELDFKVNFVESHLIFSPKQLVTIR
jgi:hypothetical protein